MGEGGYFDGGIKAMWTNACALLDSDGVHDDVDGEALYLAWNRLAYRILDAPIADIADARAMLSLLEYINDHSPNWEGLGHGVDKLRAYISDLPRLSGPV